MRLPRPLIGRALAGMIVTVLSLVACSNKAPPPKAAPAPMEVTVVSLKPQTITLTRELAGRALVHRAVRGQLPLHQLHLGRR